MSELPLDPVTGLPIPSTRTIAEIFEEDPLKLSDQDFDLVIAELRKDRERYLQAKSEPKAKKIKAVAGPKSEAIDIDDLFA